MVIRSFLPFYDVSNTFQTNLVDVVVDQLIDYNCTKKFCGAGSFSLTLPLTRNNLRAMQSGYILAVGGISISSDWLIIEDVSYDRASGKITVSGKDLNSLLSRRRTLFGDTQVPGAQGYDIISGTTAECVKHYLDNNMISPDDSERGLPGFVFDEFHMPAGILNDSYMSRLEDLQIVVEDLCSNAGLGYRIYGWVNSDCYAFRLLEGTDRSINQTVVSPVILSAAHSNIITAGFTHSTGNLYNAFYATGADVTQTVYRDNSAVPTGYGRRETAIEVGAVSVSDIRQYALYQMRDNLETHTVTADVKPGMAGTDFFLGDTVTVQDDITGNYYSAQVTEISSSLSGTADKTAVTLGQPNPKILNRIITGIYNGTIRRR